MVIAPPVRWAFFPLDEELGLRPKVGFTPKVEEGMARLGTWMPFRAAQGELAFFLGVEVAEASVRDLTEQAGAAQVQVQAAEVEALLSQRPESPAGPEVQLVSPDGALIQLVSGEWKEVKTLALGVVGKAKAKPGEEERVQTTALSYFSRMSEAEAFQQEALVEVYRRGVEKARTVCALSDGADWIQKWVDYHRSTAVRILDFAHALEYVSKAGQAASEHLGLQEPAPSQQDQAKRRQERFEAWRKRASSRIKDGRGGGGAGRIGAAPQPDAGTGAGGGGQDRRQESALSEPAPGDDAVCVLSGAGLSHWQWECGECQQARGAESHEASGDALGAGPRECHVGDAQPRL